MAKHAFENLLRTPWELMVSGIALSFGALCLLDQGLVGLSTATACMAALPFFTFAIIRGYQGLRVWCYLRRLLELKSFAMATHEVPCSRDNLYVGQGFTWLPLHRQRLHLLSQVHNQRFLQRGKLYRWIQTQAEHHPHQFYRYLQKFPPFKSAPALGGKPWLHGVGSEAERKVFIKQRNRNSHMVIFGRTRVGKTRLMSILVNQDIRNGEAVLVIDPKGDLELLQDMYSACRAAGRLNDFIILHAGFPELSAKYNPLSQYTNISEVATRVTAAIQADGEGKQFQDFAWKYLNIVATCLAEMGIVISYQSLAFYVTRLDQLLAVYADFIMPTKDAGYAAKVQRIIQESSGKLDKQGEPVPELSRAKAIQQYLKDYIEKKIRSELSQLLQDQILVTLYDAAVIDKQYYDKITASLGPVFDKINKTAASTIFSWEQAFGLPEVKLEDVIKRKQVAYIGLDAMSNKAMSEAIGQALIADLVSMCGRLYKDVPGKKRVLNLYADEFSEIVRDEFITLLNKAGGAGIQVIALSQTLNDLYAAFGSNHDKPKMLLGNFGTMGMMCIANLDTATTFTECLEKIRARSTTPSTMSNDKADGQSGELFTTYNTDAIAEEATEIITVNDLFSLPKGHVFFLTDAGTLYKVRIPLPINDENHLPTFETMMSEVNLCCA